MSLAFTRLRLAAIAGAFALAASGAQAETVLHRGNGAEPETLDHHKSTGVTEANIIYDLQEGLLVFSPNGEPAPGVAESWDISDDGKVYTFHLRADAKWSNGDPVTAEDFVYSLRRAVEPPRPITRRCWARSRTPRTSSPARRRSTSSAPRRWTPRR